jgi:hypothetical protein
MSNLLHSNTPFPPNRGPFFARIVRQPDAHEKGPENPIQNTWRETEEIWGKDMLDDVDSSPTKIEGMGAAASLKIRPHESRQW